MTEPFGHFKTNGKIGLSQSLKDLGRRTEGKFMADTASQPAKDASAETTLNQARDDNAAGNRRRGNLLLLLGAVVVVAAIAYAIYWFSVASHYVSTDNAYVNADTAEITPLAGAPVLRVLVHDTQQVKAGDILVQLDDSDAQLAVAQARADLARAQADFSRAQVDLGRRSVLAPSGAVSRDELTAAQNSSSTSSAVLQAARARLAVAELTLSRMIIRAPIDGVVSDKNVDVGQRVEAGAHLMVIAPIYSAYVDANFKENQLQNVAVGQPVILHSDIYGGRVTYHGRVVGFSGGTGAAFSLIPAQNASGNWIKVVQRVPVRINLDPAELHQHPLRVGMSMDAQIDISRR
jgi:membrane fusion protein (multidrug efflux system)